MWSDEPEGQQANDEQTLRYGPLAVDVAGFSVTVHGRDVRLTLGEFMLLVELARQPYKVLDRQLLAAVMKERGIASETDQPSARSIDVVIHRLRGWLRKAGYDPIETMRFVGYRFVPK
ncbi:MAG: winged helix-turn-helix domain-containing protein [Dehalococcoidia bacterium]